jgi:hypothetical protein
VASPRLAIHSATVLVGDVEHAGVTVIVRDFVATLTRGPTVVASAAATKVTQPRRGRVWLIDVDGQPAWVVARDGGCGACRATVGPLAAWRP